MTATDRYSALRRRLRMTQPEIAVDRLATRLRGRALTDLAEFAGLIQ